jgi:alcohol dehydrogenase class IV
MQGFRIFWPSTVHFGSGALKQHAGEIAALGKRPLVVVGPGAMEKAGVLDVLVGGLEAAGAKCSVFPGVLTDPTLKSVEQGVTVAKQHNADIVVALGGGSVIDTAKAIAAAAGSKHAIYELFRDPEASKDDSATLKIVAIPTTAGSGSELSKGAILTDTDNNVKGGLRGEHIIPALAIVDPELTLTMPPALTAETGFDVFTHAIETLLSKASTPLTRMFSIKAIECCGKYLLRCYREGGDLAAREEMSFASMLMGYNLANSSTCLPHRMQYPLSVRYGLSHGVGLAALYPAWLSRVIQCGVSQFDSAMRAWGGDSPNLDAFLAWMDELGLPVSLPALGVKELDDDLPAMTTGNLALDPCYEDQDTVRGIFQGAMSTPGGRI